MSQGLPGDRYVDIGGVNTRYWAAGDGERAVILIHGLGGYLENWYENILPLAEHHRVYALDMVGFGRSDKPEAPYSLSYLARFVRDFLDQQEIERATLVGNSLGGGISLQTAIDYPQRVEALVLVASAGLGKEVAGFLRLVTLPLVGEMLTRPSREGSARLMAEIVYDPSQVTDEAIDLDYELACLPGTQKAFLRTARCSLGLGGVRPAAYRPILDHLGSITVPTLVVWGAQDTILPVAHARIAQERMPNVQVHIFDRCGHVPMLERAAEFNALVLDFLAA